MQLLFADQLGPHFDLGGEILLPEVLSQFSKRRYHRQKAHLILYAIRRRARDERVSAVSLDSYRELGNFSGINAAISPTSREMLALAKSLKIELHEPRGFCSSSSDWTSFRTDKSPRLENFYRRQRARLDVLMEGPEPVGGVWNYDHENRKPAPKGGLGLAHFEIIEDEIDQGVRETLDELEKTGAASFIGVDGPRKFAGNRQQAIAALNHFIEFQLDAFGPYEDAVFDGEWVLAHSMLSAPMNLGLLDPMEVVRAVEAAFLRGEASIQSAEGFIRQVIGWRDYVWHLYWEYGPDYLESNFLQAHTPLPTDWSELQPQNLEANCLSKTIGNVSENAWAHHIQRLMILGNVALQRGYDPKAVNDWLVDAFVDGTPWVMPANVIGMSLFADGGRMSTKPYAAGGSYINKMSNYCGGCRFDPKIRLGPNACPITAGYWSFLAKNETRLAGNQRMWQAYSGLRRLGNVSEIVAQEAARDSL